MEYKKFWIFILPAFLFFFFSVSFFFVVELNISTGSNFHPSVFHKIKRACTCWEGRNLKWKVILSKKEKTIVMIIIFIFLFISCWSDFQKYVKGWSLENTNKLINNLFKFLEFLGNTSSTKMPKQFNFLQLSISGLLSVSFFPQPCFPIKIIFSFVYFQVCYYI